MSTGLHEGFLEVLAYVNALEKEGEAEKMKSKRALLKIILRGLPYILRRTAKKHPDFRAEMMRRDCVVQIELKDNSLGRYYKFQKGKLSSSSGVHPNPDVIVIFRDAPTALTFMMSPQDRSEIVHAVKQFRAEITGRDEDAVWFFMLISRIRTEGMSYGTPMPDGTLRLTTNTNGGPLFVYVKDGKIVRITPLEFDETDPGSYSINARGKTFKPWRKSTPNPHALALKSLVYSDKRILYPMKRVDFDPNGERNIESRGVSGYERISWDEAFDIVASEIKRMKRQYGPGAIAMHTSSHQQWGNVNYYMSAFMRYRNLVGATHVLMNPDSWEGWYWGAMHHHGNALRLGLPGFYGTVEDCLKEAEMIVFWSSDPESTNGPYGGFEGTQRRFWAKELGIEFVHIDPHLNPTAQVYGGKWIPVRPGTDSALAQAIMHVWVDEDLYDKDYVEKRTTGFDEWKDYLTGKTDGKPKTPEWQESETGVPSRVVRALARSWAKKKTYLSAGGLGTGFGGACRSATGAQWARNMILMMAMQGWGKPGINFGNLQIGTPLNYLPYFPGDAEGGISGELVQTAGAVNNYTRMPHILTMNPVKQLIPRQGWPEAIINGHAQGVQSIDGSSMEAQFEPYNYPMKGYSRVHMLHRFGASHLGTLNNSNRMIKAYRHPSLEFVVNQSIYAEGETQFADIILPACTSFERWDISEWANTAGYIHDYPAMLNHRIITMQHKCIEPLGESKSDYDISLGILERLGLGAMYTEGCSDIDWCERQFASSDLPKQYGVKWKDFLKKGYYVIPPEPEETRDPVSMSWYAEGRKKQAPEPMPLPSQYGEEYGMGLDTQSGKIEFVSSSLKRCNPDDYPDRPALNKYISSWEGLQTKDLVKKYPLQMLSTHPRYSFHTYGDGKNSTINDIKDHRVLVDGYYYWVMRMNPKDAKARGIRHHELIRVFNDRGAVICAADVSPLTMEGVVKSFESCAEFDPLDRDGFTDRGGCVNVLTPARRALKGTEMIAPNSCLVQIEKWDKKMSGFQRPEFDKAALNEQA
jgi:trimethylamine-N-oxide reductase (cytochrome c)